VEMLGRIATVAGKLYIGTSGWNYKHWRGIFYPEKLPQSQWLDFYARHFDTVEINNSFYRLPERETFESWHDSSPEGFTFAVKASRFLTHLKKLSSPEEPLDRMLSHTSALGEKLGPILYQLPPHWSLNLDRLSYFLGILPRNLRHVFEFRDSSWQVKPVFELLRKHRVGYCIMSSPDLPCNIMLTADFAYIRMHNGGYATGGNYTDNALRWWADQIRPILAEFDTYVYFNNDWQGYAIQNAEMLRGLLTTAG
jgi:uncharacterized protein YecE (DUF72 family)